MFNSDFDRISNGGEINVYRSLNYNDMINLLHDNCCEVVKILLDHDILLDYDSIIIECSEMIVNRGCLRIAQLFVDKFANLDYLFNESIKQQKLQMIYFCLAKKVVISSEHLNMNTSPDINALLRIFEKEQ